MTNAAGIQYIALDQLYLHPLNPRQTVPDGDAELMADTISIAGLLQNLIGLSDPDHRDGVGIVGGGRRLRGLQYLAQHGTDIGKVPVVVTKTHAAAMTAAAAENESAARLSPAQEIRLYARLSDNALSPGAIARANGVSERHVRQRLRLAALPEPVIEALEAREISIDAARALTVCDDPARILEILASIRGRDVSTFTISRALEEGAVRSDDERAVFVTEPTYLAEGGLITRDLFSEKDLWTDPAKLDRLFREKLTAAAFDIFETEGWAEVRTAWNTWGPNESDRAGLAALYPEPVDLPEADAAELERLSETAFIDLTPAVRERMEELEARARGDYTDDQRAASIIFIWVDRMGKLQRSDAYTPRATAAKTDRAGKTTPDAAPDVPGLSQALRDDLNRIATAALQAALLDRDNLDLTLALLTYEADLYAYNRVTGVQIHEPPNMPSEPSGLTLPDAITEVHVGGQKPDAAALTALLDGQADDFLRRLQTIVARSASARFDPYGRAIMAEAGIDIREHWTPNAANFFGRCKPAYLRALFAELVPDAPSESAEAFAAQKKDQMADTLAKIFAGDPDSRAIWRADDDATAARIATWLPQEITLGEGYE